jgi:hypothetical protein
VQLGVKDMHSVGEICSIIFVSTTGMHQKYQKVVKNFGAPGSMVQFYKSKKTERSGEEEEEELEDNQYRGQQ